MRWIRTRIGVLWRRVNTLEPIPNDEKQPGYGLVPDDHPQSREGPVVDFLRDLPPGAAGSDL